MLKVGILAESIRGRSRDIGDRLEEMLEILKAEGRHDLIQEIEDSRDDIYYDGRWFRDCWSGPYGSDIQDLETYTNVRNIIRLCEGDTITQDFQFDYRSSRLLYASILVGQVMEGRNEEDLKDVTQFLFDYPIYSLLPIWKSHNWPILSLSYLTYNEMRKIERKSYFKGF